MSVRARGPRAIHTLRYPAIVRVTLFVILGCVACASSPASPPSPATTDVAPARATGSAPRLVDTPPSASSSSPPPPKRHPAALAHCPCAARGAHTTVRDIDRGVGLRIVADDADGVRDVQTRANDFVAAALQRQTAKHDGNGGGGGLTQRCPVVIKDTDIDLVIVKDGVTITLRARKPAELDWLRRETRERLRDLTR